ncbi:MAG: TIGR02300 family protein [Alphaproteobacteria bacterium]
MSTALNPMGLKRICTSCGGRFYDMNNRPIICPTCDTEYTGEVKAKSRRGRVAAVEATKEAPAQKDDGEIQDEDPEVEVVSLEDADETTLDEEDNTDLGEDTLDDIPDVGVEVDDDPDADDALLDTDED